MKHCSAIAMVLAGITGGGPATAQMKMQMPAQTETMKPSIPTMIADKSKATNLTTPIEPGMRGYGTRGVEGRTLAEMKTHCVDTATMDAVHKARCNQLRRTLQAAPVNTR